MIFQVNEDILKKRLKFYIPIAFLIMAAISVGSYSILLKTIYQPVKLIKRICIYIYSFFSFIYSSKYVF